MKVFVTGTDTDVGKTVVSACLMQALPDAVYFKPIQTGSEDELSCDHVLIERMGGKVLPNCYSYRKPMSPDQAAAKDGTSEPDLPSLVCSLKDALSQHDRLIIEGAGGLYVPFNESCETWIDLLEQAPLPVLLVARTGLGTLNHTALSIRALQSKGLDLLGVILSGEQHPENLASLRRMFPEVHFHHLPTIDLGDCANAADSLKNFVAANHQRLSKDRSPHAWLPDDLNHAWHPFTQHRIAPEPLALDRAKGIYLYTSNGEQLVDGNSSWWVNTIGHGRDEIHRAISRQQARLDHVLFAGATHQPAAELSRRITEFAGSHLSRAFFSDNGSTAVEVGLKMAYQSFVNRGESQRNLFLAFEGSYHGDTFGTMSVAASDGFHGAFKPLMFETLRATPPTSHPSYLCPEGMAEYDQKLADLKHLLALQHKQIAGVIIEPLVQGASGMLMQPERFLQDLESLCRQYELPLIFDEVFTGLGRIGSAFAFQRAGVKPDIICLAKGLTGGTMPLSLTLASDAFFDAFLDDDKSKALLHGHSYTANAIACAAANATLDIYKNEALPQRARQIEAQFLNFIASHSDLRMENPRAMGAIFATEIPGSGFGDYFNAKAARIPSIARQHGLFLRPLGNTLYFIPPLTITDDEVAFCLQGIGATLEELRDCD